jgi:hypothetical protein
MFMDAFLTFVIGELPSPKPGAGRLAAAAFAGSHIR